MVAERFVCFRMHSIMPMSPRKKATDLQSVVSSSSSGGGGWDRHCRSSELKDYMNELSHEVLCHIFR